MDFMEFVCKKCGRDRKHHGKGMCASCYQTDYRNKSPERIERHARINRNYRKKNKERVRKRDKDRNKKRESYRKNYNREYYQKNKEKLKKYQRDYRKNNLEMIHAHYSRKMARKRGDSNASITGKEWIGILEKHDHRCYYCGHKHDSLEQEHKTPLSRGGKHVVSNVVPACFKCNREKGAMTEGEYSEYIANGRKFM